jgi:hypothetical protein
MEILGIRKQKILPSGCLAVTTAIITAVTPAETTANSCMGNQPVPVVNTAAAKLLLWILILKIDLLTFNCSVVMILNLVTILD